MLLAETIPTPHSLPTLPGGAHWPREADLVHWCQGLGPGMAAAMLAAGVVFLLWGYPVFRFLMMLNFGVVGAYVGASLGKTGDTAVAGACVGGFIAAAVAWPLMKWAVALTGAAIGTVAGAALWRVSGQDPALDWAGGLIGLVAFGMMSFIIFRGGVMVFTSLQGAGLVASGLLGFLYKYPNIGPKLTQVLSARPFILPCVIVLPAVVGLIYQQHQVAPPVVGGPPKKPPGK